MRVPKKKKIPKLFSFLYRLDKALFFMSYKRKLRLYLDLAWIFDWLSLENSLKVYEDYHHPRLKELKPFLERYINRETTIVDFGCSTGTMADFYSNFSKEVIAIDFIKEDIDEARRHYKKDNIKFIYADAYKYLSEQKQRFEVLVFAHVVGYFEKPHEVFKKFKPFFNRIFIEVPDFDFSYTNHYRKREQRDLIFTDKNYVHEFNRKEILSEIDKAGLKVTDLECRNGQIRIWCEC